MLYAEWCIQRLQEYCCDGSCISLILFRKVGKRKAATQADKSSKRKAKKEKMAKKDPNKPKRPPSAFFVFLFVSLSVLFCFFEIYRCHNLKLPLFNVTVRSSGKSLRKKTRM